MQIFDLDSVFPVMTFLKDIISMFSDGAVGDRHIAASLFFPPLTFRISSTDNALNDAFLRVSVISLFWTLESAKALLTAVFLVATAKLNSNNSLPSPNWSCQFLHHHIRRTRISHACRLAQGITQIKGYQMNYIAMCLFRSNHITIAVLIVTFHWWHDDFCEWDCQSLKKMNLQCALPNDLFNWFVVNTISIKY